MARDLAAGENKVRGRHRRRLHDRGMAYEGLNHAGHLNKDLVVILNDNEMSISENVGALSNLLSPHHHLGIRAQEEEGAGDVSRGAAAFGRSVLQIAKRAEESLKGFFTPGMLFEAFGFEYIGPIDGHDIPLLLETLENVKRFDDAVLIHVLTKKGKGYRLPRTNPSLFHGVGRFRSRNRPGAEGERWGRHPTPAIFGETLKKLAAGA